MSSSKKANQEKSLGGTRVGKIIIIIAALGWITAGVLITDKIQDNRMTSTLHGALVRSHSERCALSQELERISAELDIHKDRLSRYQGRKVQAATNPPTFRPVRHQPPKALAGPAPATDEPQRK